MNKRANEISRELAALADGDKAVTMAAYMKTTMPFFGVMKDDRVAVLKRILKAQPIASDDDYVSLIQDLWKRGHREEKYSALWVAMKHPRFNTLDCMPLWERMIREGQWWDFVDDIAIRLVGDLYR